MNFIERNTLYIDGQWVSPRGEETCDVVNPATESVCAKIVLGNAQDVDMAVAAARRAFLPWSQTPCSERRRLITAVVEKMQARQEELTHVISQSMGCPLDTAASIQVEGPIYGMASFADRAALMDKADEVGHSLVVREAIGVCAFINPWNYPLHQFVGKVAPALAAGCTMVVKPSEQTPLQDFIMAEIFDEVGLPAGVFNLVTGLGPCVGEALSSHPDVDLVSFTGSTRAGIHVAQAAAPTVKRVTQELGGKSPYIITEDADLAQAVAHGVCNVMVNSGQTCTAWTRMLVPASRYEEAVEIAKATAVELPQGPQADAFLGPVSSQAHRDRVREYIDLGIHEGARLVCGGSQQPEHLSEGFYIAPTIFADVNNHMRIAREEIFGPVLCMIPYKTLEEAITIANDTDYGLCSAVWAKDKPTSLAIARQLRSGQTYLQDAAFNYDAPFGGYKQSGNGREYGEAGLDEFVELKAIQGGAGI